MFCSLYVFDPFPAFPFQTFFLLGSVFLFALFDQITYFKYIVGKSTPLSVISESLMS